MKTLLFAIALFFSFNCFAGGNDKAIKDTTIKNVSYKMYEGSRGGHYIVVTSKTGNTYKKYIKR